MLNWRDPSNPQAGGAERVSRAYLAALAARDHDVFWFANDFASGASEETIDGIRIVRGGGKGTSIWKAVQWNRGQKPFDLVIDQHHGIPWFAPWWCGTKYYFQGWRRTNESIMLLRRHGSCCGAGRTVT